MATMRKHEGVKHTVQARGTVALSIPSQNWQVPIFFCFFFITHWQAISCAFYMKSKQVQMICLKEQLEGTKNPTTNICTSYWPESIHFVLLLQQRRKNSDRITYSYSFKKKVQLFCNWGFRNKCFCSTSEVMLAYQLKMLFFCNISCNMSLRPQQPSTDFFYLVYMEN